MIGKNGILFIALLLLSHVSAFAGSISEAFSGEVFGVPWGANLETIKEKFPDGDIIKTSGMHGYIVKDGRTIFGLDRPDNSIAFNLDADGELSGIDIEFPLVTSNDFGLRMAKFRTVFGAPSGPITTSNRSLRYDWPEESGIKFSVTGIFGVFGLGGKTLARITYSLPKKAINKADLGL